MIQLKFYCFTKCIVYDYFIVRQHLQISLQFVRHERRRHLLLNLRRYRRLLHFLHRRSAVGDGTTGRFGSNIIAGIVTAAVEAAGVVVVIVGIAYGKHRVVFKQNIPRVPLLSKPKRLVQTEALHKSHA